MYILNMEIKEDRQVEFLSNFGGNILENNATLLNIRIPKIYSSYYKYLDIVKDNKEKTQTVVSTKDEYILSYPLPDTLTGARELTCQLVLKKDSEVFKSNIFKLTFSGSINSTQLIENKNPDTLEFLMENKADEEELIKIEERKLDKNTFYSFRDNQDEINSLKADKEEMKRFLSDKVDKVKGKGLSTNDFTTFLKTKLEEGVMNYIGEISSEDELKDITSYGIYAFILRNYNATSYDENTVRKSGFLINGWDEYYKITGQNKRTIYQHVFYPEERMLKRRITEDETEWTEFEICGYISDENFTTELKDKLCNLYSKEEIDLIRDNIDEAMGAVQSAHERIDMLSDISDNNFSTIAYAIDGTDSGKTVTLTDITPYETDLNISLEGNYNDFSEVNVTARGINIFNPNVYLTPKTQSGVTIRYIPEEDVFCIDGTAIADTYLRTSLPELIKLDKNSLYGTRCIYVSGSMTEVDEKSSKLIYFGQGDTPEEQANFVSSSLKDGNGYRYQPTKNYLTSVWIYMVKAGDVFDNYKFRAMLYKGTDEYGYLKYSPIQTVTAKSDGTVNGLKSISPITVVETDKEDITINCKYKKDINKAFMDIQQAIISLGGNV